MTQPPSMVSAALRQADALLMQGRWPEAIPLYRQVLAAAPSLADTWFNLGYALRHAGDYGAALDAYAQALRHGARSPEQIHVNRAVILTDYLADHASAEAELRRALELAPQHVSALLNLGNLYEEQGARAPAAECYARVLALPAAPPSQAATALARLAPLRPPSSTSDPLLLQLRRAAASPAPIGDEERASLHFSMGRALDGLGDYAAAFAAFTAGKQWAHRAAPAYREDLAEQRSRTLIAAFPAPTRSTAPDSPAPSPLFICGMFRSGSTLLEQVLAAHPAIATAGESESLPRMVRDHLSPFPASMSTLTTARLHTLASAYRTQLLQQARPQPEARYVTDKRPDNYLLIGLIKQLFPTARIIHTVRHPVDNGLSILMQQLNPRAFDYAARLESIGHHYAQYRNIMRHWTSLHGEDIHDFDYDRFVTEPESELRAVLKFLGLPWHDGCLSHHTRKAVVKTASYWQVRRPIHRDRVGHWRHYRRELQPLLDTLAAQGIDIGEA